VNVCATGATGARLACALALALALAGCSAELDAGSDVPHGLLPIDERSAIVLVNDGARDNWQGEYAALLASSGQARWVGLVVNAGEEHPSLDVNLSGYRGMIAAARDSGLENLPDPVASSSTPLQRPASGLIDDTTPNRSEGARFLVQAAAEHARPGHPLVLATGGRLTEVADAFLMDPSFRDRVVVVASLGPAGDGPRADTFDPNGGRDLWATFIVTSRLRVVQVNSYYDQSLDVPDERLPDLPQNSFGRWMADKRADTLKLLVACDQITVFAAALPWFATEVARMRVDDSDTRYLIPDPAGAIWRVTRGDDARARDEIWRRLEDPTLFE
jgi:hypothetical protein